MKNLFICPSATKYGASKTSATTETALGSDDLRDGAIGIFGLCADGKTRLIVPANASDATKALVTDFKGSGGTYNGTKIQIARGTATGALISPWFDYTLMTTKGKENELPMYQMSFLGYDAVAALGSLNFVTPVVGDSAGISGNKSLLGYSEPLYFNYDTALVAGQSAYDTLLALAKSINTDNYFQADIVGAAGTAGTAMSAGTGITVTKGSPNISGTGMTVLTAGNWLRINNTQPLVPPSTNINKASATPTAANSVLYKIVSASATAIVLDRPYTGETQTGLTFTTLYSSTESALSASLGLRLIIKPDAYPSYPKVTNLVFDIKGMDNLSYATYARERGAQTGSGTTEMMINLERLFNPYKGYNYGGDDIMNVLKPAPSYVDLSCNTYDLYFTLAERSTSETNDNVTVPDKGTSEIVVAFPTANSGSGDNQNSYDALIKLLSAYQGDVVLGS